MGDISAILNATAKGSATTSAQTGTSGATSLASNFNTFLTLLTTQLKHQDPSNPVDSNQFTQQLVEFAGVQQQVQSNAYLQQILASTQANQIGSASSYIGTTIQASGSQGAVIGGKGQFGYTLDAAAAQTQVTITDSTGKVVFNGTGGTAQGENIVSWDGKNSITGAQMPDGTYNITVNAKDATGKTVKSTAFETGVVTSASISNGEVVLSIGSMLVPVSGVTAVTGLSKNSTASS